MSEPQKQLQAQASLVDLRTDDELRQILFLAILKQGELANRVSTGFLITSGAIASMLLPNLATLDPVIPSAVSMRFLFCILASTVLGLIQKFCAVMAVSTADAITEITGKFQTVFDKRDESARDINALASQINVGVTFNSNPLAAFEPVIQEMPWAARWYMRRTMRKAAANHLYTIQRGMGFLRSCVYAGFAQMIVFFGAFIYALLNVKTP